MKQLFLILYLMFSHTLFAIVTIKPLDIGEKKPGNSGEISFSWQVNSGNTNTDSIASGLYLQADYNKSLMFLKASYNRGSSLGVLNIDKTFLHIRHIHKLSKHYDNEIFAQQQSDSFQSLTSRTLAGDNIRWSSGDPKTSGRFYIAIGAFYLTELETNLPQQNYARANFYLSYKYTPSKQYTYAVITYYQPRINDSNDFLQYSTAEVGIALSKKLALKFSIKYSVNSDPFLGVSPFDYSQNTALKYVF